MSRTKKEILPLNEEDENESDASDIESEEDEEKKELNPKKRKLGDISNS